LPDGDAYGGDEENGLESVGPDDGLDTTFKRVDPDEHNGRGHGDIEWNIPGVEEEEL
jgi:hypothetical protein